MSYFIPTSKIKVNKQESFEYALFKAFSECFDKVTISNNLIITSMRINYQETGKDLQAKMESLCQEEAKRFTSAIPHKYRKNAKVSIIRWKNYHTEIRFTTKDMVIRVTGVYKNKDSEVRINILT